MIQLNDIIMFQASAKAGEDAFNALRDDAAAFNAGESSKGGDAWVESIYETECEWFEQAVDNGWVKDKNGQPITDRAKLIVKKTGKWKTSLMPRGYCTAKSALAAAMNAGVDISTGGKTEIEKRTRTAKASTKPEKTELEKAMVTVSTLSKIYAKLDEHEKSLVQSEVRAQFDLYL